MIGKKLIAFFSLGALLMPHVLFAVEPDDTDYDELWYLERIGAPEAWEISTGSREIVIAVLDAGIDTDHPDLEANLAKNSGEINNNNIDDDGNGYVDDFIGWDFVDGDEDVNPSTGNGADDGAISHGTVIAGIIGAIGNNAEGVTGVNWSVSVLPVRMLDDVGSGNSINASDAIDYAVEMGADVINLSFSGDTRDPLLGQAIERAYDAGVVVVAALGNENQNVNLDKVFPACYGNGDEDWVIGVASLNPQDQKSSFSNYGSDCVDISAPGEDLYGLAFEDGSEEFNEPYLGYWSGTSMAAPMVSGAAALLLSVYPTLTPDDVSTILKLSVDPLSLIPKFQGEMGSGRLNIARAIEMGASFADAVEETVDVEDEPAEPADGIIVAGDVITAPESSSVYYLPTIDERYAFINETAYFTHYDSFDVIEETEFEILGQFALKGLMLPKSGVVLVKIQSDPTVYLLEENPNDPFSPVLRAIDSELIAHEMYGANWADYVIDIEPTFFTRFTVGDPVTSAIEVDTSIMKTRDELAELAK